MRSLLVPVCAALMVAAVGCSKRDAAPAAKPDNATAVAPGETPTKGVFERAGEKTGEVIEKGAVETGKALDKTRRATGKALIKTGEWMQEDNVTDNATKK